ncbi:MAG: hypothetical protein QOJ52_4131 [Acidimicrobiaceae bacterium]|jgi:hypothetical protein|nr:hypothetical protein [Acidimicrobiaceae bacterium]
MNRKFYFSFLAFALTLLATVAFVVGHNTGARADSTSAALAALPASDFVIVVDMQRALGETLPSLLASNPALLAKMNAELEKFERETGINPRSFKSIAIGGRLTASKPHDQRTVVIASGSFNSDTLLENAFAAVKAKGEKFEKEEQQYKGKRIILISQTGGTKVEAKTSGNAPATTYTIEQGRRMSIAVLDSNTLAVGELEGVRASIDASLVGGERVDNELVQLATQTPGAVVGFSGKIPQSFTEKASSNSTIEKYFASIRQFYGSSSADGTNAETLVTLRTETSDQAAEIGQALNTIKTLGAFGFGQSSGGNSEQANYIADILKGLSITTQGNEIQINVRVSQSSVAAFMRSIK